MKKLYFLFFLTIGFLANAQIVNIPDANFKAKLLAASPTNTIASTQTPAGPTGGMSVYHTIDTNGDGEIQLTEAQAIKYLDVGSSNISDVTGIEEFTNLIYLSTYNNQITNINLIANLYLKYLQLNNNLITSLDLTQNQSLQWINSAYNQLSLMNVSNLLSLGLLNASNNQLTTVDLSTNVSLYQLELNQNQLTSIDVSNNINLTSLVLSNNQLNTIDLTNNTTLWLLNLHYNQFVSLDLSYNTGLSFLTIYNNQILSIDLSNNTQLIGLSAFNNQISSLDLSNNTQLQSLSCENNPLTTIDVTNNPVLRSLSCSNTPSLQALFMKNGNLNPWTSLNFSGNPNLEFVCCDDEDLALVQQRILDYGYTNCNATNLSCDFKVSFEVSGNVRYDYWYDGCDINDVFVPNVKYEIFDGTETVITSGNQLGNYYIPLESGNYTITPILENPTYFQSLPNNLVVDFTAPSPPVVQNFCVVDLDYLTDLEIVMLPLTPARPGFEATYRVIVRNKAHDFEFVNVNLTYDNSILNYVSSLPLISSSTPNTVTWQNLVIAPFETRYFDIKFNLNSPSDTPPVNIDDELVFHCDIFNINLNVDNTPDDNTFTLNQTVVGSYDPNDKVCLQGETEDVSIVGEYVHYMIRFENTGTFLAEKVVVEDFIDVTKFDVSTLIPLHASHSYYTKITGNKVEFIFDNINLDFNAPNNGGFISFKIKLLPTLTIGDTFSNYVNIYFDFNPPIVTDTYTTTIVALSSTSFDFNNHFVLYPNPAKETVSIQSKDGIGINSIEIYNNIGQMILSTTNASNAIAISNLASGIYFVKVNTDKGTANTKFIKE